MRRFNRLRVCLMAVCIRGTEQDDVKRLDEAGASRRRTAKTGHPDSRNVWSKAHAWRHPR